MSMGWDDGSEAAELFSAYLEKRAIEEIKDAIKVIFNYENNQDAKFNTLTDIGLNHKSKEIFQATEELRNELSPGDASRDSQALKEKVLQNPVVGIDGDDSDGQEGADEGAAGECE